jgi:hypothetical protein
MPNRLKNIQVEGWGKILKEIRQLWLEGKETILETSYFEYFEGSEAVENRIYRGQ